FKPPLQSTLFRTRNLGSSRRILAASSFSPISDDNGVDIGGEVSASPQLPPPTASALDE
ncbi:hypothetical protein Dimus_025132, partial [Dionaea muscipula]